MLHAASFTILFRIVVSLEATEGIIMKSSEIFSHSMDPLMSRVPNTNK